MIKVHNLFNKDDGNYVNSNKIVKVENGEVKKLDDVLDDINNSIEKNENRILHGSSATPLNFTLERGMYLLVTIVGSTNSNATGVYVLNIFSNVYSSYITLNDSDYVSINLDGYTLTLSRQGSYRYSLLSLG